MMFGWLRRMLGPESTAGSVTDARLPRPINRERHDLRNKQAILWGRLQLDAQRAGINWKEELSQVRAEWDWERRLYSEPLPPAELPPKEIDAPS